MKRLFAACLLPAFACAGLVAAEPPDQPLYQGKALDFWLHQLKDDDLLAREEAISVLADAGPAAETALPALKGLLKDPAATVRLQAAVAVWKIGRKSDAVTPVLIEALKSPGRSPRLTALQTLAQIGPDAKDALPALQAALADADAVVRQRAADVLEQMGTVAAPVLAGGLKDADPQIRRDLATALGRLGPDAKDAVQALKDILKDDDKRVRLAAAGALLRAAPGDAAAVAALLDAVKDADADTRRQAGESLLHLRPRPKEAAAGYAAMLKDAPDLPTRLDAAEALWEVNRQAKEVLSVLTEALRGNDSNARQRSLMILARLGPDAKGALPDLMPLLKAGALPNAVCDVFHAIGPEAVPTLTASLQGNMPLGQAINMLGNMGTDSAPAVLKLLDDPDRRVRSTAVIILGQIGPAAPGVLPALIDAAKNDKDPGMRGSALSALGVVGPEAKAAEAVLVEALGSKAFGVRSTAIQVLPRFRLDAADLPALDDALKDDNAYVRAVAAELRWRIDRKTGAAVDALTPLSADATARQATLQALGRIAAADKKAVPALAGLLQDPDRQTRMQTVLALDKAGPNAEAAIPALTEALKSEDPLVRNGAARLLALLGADAKTAVPVLVATLKGPPDLAALQAVEALGRYGKEAASAAPALHIVLNNPNLLFRAAAAQTLARIDPAEKTLAADALLDGLSMPAPALSRLLCAAVLCQMDPSATGGRAVLRAALSDPDPAVRAGAYLACGEAGPSVKGLLPLLERALTDETEFLRLDAATAVWKVGGRPEKPVAALVDGLKDPTYALVRSQAATRLGAMGADAKAAVPALLGALKERTSLVRFAAAEALPKVDPEAAAKANIP